ncbi:MAG: hypothetical protein AAF916_12220, partial [Planctomycetota bacterium]
PYAITAIGTQVYEIDYTGLSGKFELLADGGSIASFAIELTGDDLDVSALGNVPSAEYEGPIAFPVTLIDDETGDEIAGEVVHGSRNGLRAKAETDAEGVATLAVDLGSWNFLVAIAGYVSASRTVDVVDGGSTEIRLTPYTKPAPSDSSKALIVLDLRDQYTRPAVAADVKAELIGHLNPGDPVVIVGSTHSVVSDDQGRAEINTFPNAVYRMLIVHDGISKTLDRVVTPAAGETLQLDMSVA